MDSISDEEYRNIITSMDKCPFCGSKDGTVMVVHFHHWVCVCNHCDAQGPVRETPQKALEGYNRRAS